MITSFEPLLPPLLFFQCVFQVSKFIKSCHAFSFLVRPRLLISINHMPFLIFLAVSVLLSTFCSGVLAAADDLRPGTARWLDGDRLLVLSDVPATAPWLASLTAACASGQPTVTMRVECSTARVAVFFRKMERLKVSGEVVLIAVGDADARAMEKSKKSEVIDEFQRRLAAYATGFQAMGAVVVVASTSENPMVLSAVRGAANTAGVAVSTLKDLVATIGLAAAHVPPRITIAGDRVFTKDTTLHVNVERVDPKTAKVRWWLEPGDERKAIIQSLGKPIKVSVPGLVQVRVEDSASGINGSSSVFLRKIEALRPGKVGKLIPGWTWRSGILPLTKSGEFVLPTEVSGIDNGAAALAEWPAAAGEAPRVKGSGSESALVVLFDGYLTVNQQEIYRFMAKGPGTVRLDIGEQLVLEHPSRDTRDGVTIGSVPLLSGSHRVRLALVRFPESEPATLTWWPPKSTSDRPLQIGDLGTLAPGSTNAK